MRNRIFGTIIFINAAIVTAMWSGIITDVGWARWMYAPLLMQIAIGGILTLETATE